MVVFLLSCAGFRGRNLLQGFWFIHQKWLGWTIRWAQKPVISRVTTPLIAIITPVNPIYFHPFLGATRVCHSMYNDRLGGPPCTVLCFHFFNFHAWRFNNFKRSPHEEKRDDWKTIGSPSFFFWRGKTLLLVLSIFAGSHYLNKYYVHSYPGGWP